MDTTHIEALISITGERNVLFGKDQVLDYLKDETPETIRPEPSVDVVVVKPANASEVAGVLKFASEKRICVFVRGGGTGLVGGSIPSRSGLILSLERMKRLEIDKDNLMAVAEAGATLAELIEKAKEAGLQFPLHPGDENAQIGGLAATNAGGANAIRHGVMRNYIKGLEVVLASGKILSLGGKLQKNNVGYDLMNLIIGSEGTLAVVTKAIVRLSPRSGVTAVLIVSYDRRSEAVNTVPKILLSGRLPLAIEFVEKELMQKTANSLGEDWPVQDGNCFLLITVEEADRDQMLEESTKIGEICQKSGCLDILFAEPMDLQEKILRIRSNVYSALKQDTADILDVTVPPASIGRLLDRVDEIAREHGVYLPAYGHVGDGNLHVHIMKGDNSKKDSVETIRREVYQAGVALGGVITGEHGIGRTRLECISKYVGEDEILIMRKIKEVFDPKDILNPGVKIPR